MKSLIIIILLLTGCTTATVPERIVNTTKVSVGVYCEIAHNVHRIVIRVIHVIDPEWISICETYEKSKNPEEL